MLGKYLDNLRKNVPLVHNITNYVTVNDVANVLLACGGSPIMSDEPEDVEDITTICGGLNINIGTLTGLFPEEIHYEVDGNTLLEVIFRHTGGNKFEPVYGDNWDIDNVSEMESVGGTKVFTFDQGGGHFKATVNEKLSAKYGLLIVDLAESK